MTLAMVLALTACAPTPVRVETQTRPASNLGDVAGEVVEAPDDARYRPEPGVTFDPPVAFVDNAAPVYPPSLLPNALPPVVVTVALIVDGEGRVTEVSPLDANPSSDDAPFHDSVRAAVGQWRFFPLVRVEKGEGKTVIAVGDVSTTYDGKATGLPFRRVYRFTFRQVAGEGQVGVEE
jgi:outer membrane biosynthesis protein TonB